MSFILIVAVLAMGGFGFAMIQARKPGPLAADKVVVITRDDDGGSIPDQLERAGVIDSPLWFNLTLLLDGSRGKLKRGEYLFKEHVSLREAEEALISGKVLLHKVTVPEGLTSEQVVQRLRDNDVFVGDIKEIPREGSILPETYEFQRGVTRASVLAKMENDQAKLVDEIWKKRAPDLPIKSPGELVTLASIVEKETGKADERPHVAGVFINRLQKRMKLESDPTIVYGLVGGKGTLGHPISKSELQQATPYNTYIIEGLPPGPIANPGKAAMEAVANPSHTSDLFFVADGTGGHAFADTLDQHQKNVARWRQIEKDAKDRLAPDAAPPAPAAPPAKVHGALDPVDPKAFGGLAPVAATKPPAGDIAKRLARVGADRQTREALLGPSGPLSAGASTRSLADIGAVVQGVNDQSAVDATTAAADDGAATTGPIQSYPMSAAALADQQSREARYGAAPGALSDSGAKMMASADAAAAPAPSAHPGARPRAFDASEGTPLDPLLNTTYDLNFPKVVPVIK
ncbi:endolytic transglycosylase MltG [Methylocapsa sp. S129]|uniref:endolytic transglycosylase MltG n=1 Tax=Methylocapsa sp. S129 TaxID=1641869 RepID=UPI001FEF8491|nr:endolytic transglycosylase MltG [Methylocapsa sp. S129]